jgi:ferredoxin
MPTVRFINENKEIDVPEGTNLRKAALDAGVNLYKGLNGFGESINKYVNCYGWGSCGTCMVNITEGMDHANRQTICEKLKFNVPFPDPMPAMHYIGHEKTMRLACQVKVNGDMDVETGPELNLFGENFFS